MESILKDNNIVTNRETIEVAVRIPDYFDYLSVKKAKEDVEEKLYIKLRELTLNSSLVTFTKIVEIEYCYETKSKLYTVILDVHYNELNLLIEKEITRL